MQVPCVVPCLGLVSLPCGNRDLGESSQHDRLLQPHEGNEGALQEIHLPDQHVGGLSVTRQFLHEFILQLQRWKRKEKKIKLLWARSSHLCAVIVHTHGPCSVHPRSGSSHGKMSPPGNGKTPQQQPLGFKTQPLRDAFVPASAVAELIWN